MKFSILVPTLGIRSVELNRLLESLSTQEFKNFEVIIVSQINHDEVDKLVKKWSMLKIKHLKIEDKGLSLARNVGLRDCKGEWIILSDDDCWYPNDALKKIATISDHDSTNIILTQIYDPINNMSYKNYSQKEQVIHKKYQLMSKSSIEIAIKKDAIINKFDERFGLGAKYVCGEEIDFLINNFKDNKILYYPVITVFHLKKNNKNEKRIFAKGALYAKNFSFPVSFMICFRDLIKKKENNFKMFYSGYIDYKKSN